MSDVSKMAPPSAKKLMTFRYSVCVMCTTASAFLFSAVHTVVANPELNGYDYTIIVVLVIALYVENQVGFEMNFVHFNPLFDTKFFFR